MAFQGVCQTYQDRRVFVVEGEVTGMEMKIQIFVGEQVSRRSYLGVQISPDISCCRQGQRRLLMLLLGRLGNHGQQEHLYQTHEWRLTWLGAMPESKIGLGVCSHEANMPYCNQAGKAEG
jgi:hypothetical protein